MAELNSLSAKSDAIVEISFEISHVSATEHEI